MLVKQSKLIEKPAKTNNEATQPGHWTTCKAIGDQPGGQSDKKTAWQGPAPSQRGVVKALRAITCLSVEGVKEPYHDELPTFRGDTKQRRHRRNGGSNCAMDERRCRHDMMTCLSNIYLFLITVPP